ncbi:uncharacterized protein LOC141673654 [Apium graveolens]|uniref:uncharacterized protein LOC141673654 n=1 Tax=Apium graveolens TaxID=4045 RepID=UPI003D7BE420
MWKWVQFKCKLTNDIFHVVNIYGPLNLKGKRQLWVEISEILVIAGNNLVCVVGDFNSIMDEKESVNCTYRRLDVQGFKALIRSNNLCEIGMVNENFTWYRPFGRCSKLDRFLVTDNWYAADNWEVLALNKMVSDHRPLLLYVNKSTKEPVPFRAFNWWLSDENARVEMEKFCKQGKESELQENFQVMLKKLKLGLKQWRRRNEIDKFVVDGNVLNGSQEVKMAFYKYFKNIFNSRKLECFELGSLIDKRLNDEEVMFLERDLYMEEIVNALKSFSNDKTSGPDGFNMKYIKEFWPFLKDKVLEGFRLFASTGVLPKGFNSSFIALVPKVRVPNKLSKFRPISLINSVTKLLTKVLANRLNPVYDKLVGVNQFGFVKGRQAVESIFIVNEVFHFMKTSKNKGLILKLDFEKAFDSVNWSFLFKTLKCLGLGSRWIKWMEDLFKLIRLSVLVNGTPTRDFNMSNRIRQGDPLYPMLFNLTGEVLSKMLNTTSEQGIIEGLQMGKEGKKISHLQYADDTIVFLQGNEESILGIKKVLQCFQLLSGLKINFQKSSLYSCHIPNLELEYMADKLGCKGEGIEMLSNQKSYSVMVHDILGAVSKHSESAYFRSGVVRWVVADGKSALFWSGEVFWKRKLRNWELEELEELRVIVNSVYFSANNDMIIWIPAMDTYTTRVAYELLIKSDVEKCDDWEHIWKYKVPEKVKFFLWKVNSKMG